MIDPSLWKSVLSASCDNSLYQQVDKLHSSQPRGLCSSTRLRLFPSRSHSFKRTFDICIDIIIQSFGVDAMIDENHSDVNEKIIDDIN